MKHSFFVGLVLTFLSFPSFAFAATVQGYASFNSYGDIVINRIALSSDGSGESVQILDRWMNDRPDATPYIIAKGRLEQGWHGDVLLVSEYFVRLRGIIGTNQYGDVTLTSRTGTHNLTNAESLRRYKGRQVIIWVGDFRQGYEGLYLTFKGWAQ